MRAITRGIPLLMITACLWGQSSKSAPDPLTAEVRQSIMGRRAAALKHDRTAYASYLADEVTFIDDDGTVKTRTQLLDGATETDGIPESYSDPVDLTVWRAGDLVFGTYRSVEKQMYGEQALRQEFRGTHAFKRSPSGLKVVFMQATVIPNTQREGVKIDPAIFDKYVGQYSTGPGDSETVTREGDKLFYTTGGLRLEMKPIAADTFFMPGDGDDWVFLKNDKGEVVGLESRLWGQNIAAKKIN